MSYLSIFQTPGVCFHIYIFTPQIITRTCSIGYGLASRGYRTCLIDFDLGLRNLDLHLGCERRVIFDFVHVIQHECSLNQALIRDKRLSENLMLLAASQTQDKDALTEEGVARVLTELRRNFDFVLCDSPAGIEQGAKHAMEHADEAIVVTNPELSSCRDADKMIGFIASRSRRAQEGRTPVMQHLLINRYCAQRAATSESLSVRDMHEMLGLPLLGVIPESRSQVLRASNCGTPVIATLEMDNDNDDIQEFAAQALEDAVGRLLGETREMRFLDPPTVASNRSAWQEILGKWFPTRTEKAAASA